MAEFGTSESSAGGNGRPGRGTSYTYEAAGLGSCMAERRAPMLECDNVEQADNSRKLVEQYSKAQRADKQSVASRSLELQERMVAESRVRE